MMHIQINYGHAVTTLPALEPGVLERATADDLRLLLALCAHPTEDCATLAARVGLPSARLEASLAFWRGVGVLDLIEEGSISEPRHEPPVPAKPAPVPPLKAAEIPDEAPTVTVRRARAQERLPHYTTEELNTYLANNRDAREHIDECNRIWGDMLNIAEINLLIVLRDYLHLEWDYILCLLARTVEELRARGTRPSMHYVEKTAISYCDEGILTMDALQEKFRALDRLRSNEGKLRTLFGMGDRLLTPTEKKYFSTWCHDLGFDYEIIEMAYNVTVDTKGTPKMSYINSVLANWNRDDLRTPAAIEAAQAQYRADRERERNAAGGKTAPANPASSFDTDDFFGAAVRRSLGDGFKPDDPN